MLLGTLKNSSRFLDLNEDGFDKTVFDDLLVVRGKSSKTPRGLFNFSKDQIVFTSEVPYVRASDGYSSVFKPTKPLAKLIPEAENNFASMELSKTVGRWNAYVSSARITRARMYFLLVDEGILWSDDMRELIPFSSREMNPSGAFSILKYGDVPEYITVVEGIFCVPVGQQLQFGASDLDTWLKLGEIPRGAFEFFFKLVKLVASII